MIRRLLTLVIATLLVAAAAAPATAASQFRHVEMDVAALGIPSDIDLADVGLTWSGQIDPTYIECEAKDAAQSAGVLASITVACWSVQSQVITVTATYGPTSVSAALTFASPAPSGRAADYRLMRTPGGQALTYRACKVIPVHLNTGTKPRNPELEFATEFAVQQVAQASGLRLRYDGRTAYMPRRDANPPGNGIWVGYAYPGKGEGRSDLLTRGDGDELGIGGPYFYGHTITMGQVALARKNLAKFGGTPLLVETIMHELAHTVGLDHSSARGRQVMAPVATGKANVTWGRGDLRGLQKVGPGRAC